jgi:hypothetical protein
MGETNNRDLSEACPWKGKISLICVQPHMNFQTGDKITMDTAQRIFIIMGSVSNEVS